MIKNTYYHVATIPPTTPSLPEIPRLLLYVSPHIYIHEYMYILIHLNKISLYTTHIKIIKYMIKHTYHHAATILPTTPSLLETQQFLSPASVCGYFETHLCPHYDIHDDDV
jgi:hypothetical protein